MEKDVFVLRWAASRNDSVPLLGLFTRHEGHLKMTYIPISILRLRLCALKPLYESSKEELVKFIKTKTGAEHVEMQSVEQRVVVNRGALSAALAFKSAFVFTLLITKPNLQMPLPTLSDLVNHTRDASLSYCDLDPHNWLDLIEWNIQYAIWQNLPTCRLPWRIDVDRLNELKDSTLPRTVGTIFVELKLSQPDNIEFVQWAVLSPTDSMVVHSSHPNLPDSKIDIAFTLGGTWNKIIENKPSLSLAIPIQLDRAMELYTNQRWSYDEFGFPSAPTLEGLIKHAVTIAGIIGCPIESVFTFGRLQLTTALMNLCFERENILPFYAMESLSKRSGSSQKRGRNTEATPAASATSYSGGRVLNVTSNLHLRTRDQVDDQPHRLVLLDFDSYYPSIIAEYELYYKILGDNPFDSNPATFFLPLMKELIQLKRQAIDRQAVAAVKLIINPLYGSMGAGYSQVSCTEVAAGITSKGRELLEMAQTTSTSRGGKVLMGHTDSILVDFSDTSNIVESVCQQVNHGMKFIRLRVSKTFDACWIINKTHHISIIEKQDYKRVVLCLVECVKEMQALLHEDEINEPEFIGKPAALLQDFLDRCKTIMIFPGLITSAMPPMVQLLYVAVGAILVGSWQDLYSLPMDPSMHQLMGVNADLPTELAVMARELLRAFDLDNTPQSCWQHYIAREQKPMSDDVRRRGQTDANYRHFVSDLMRDSNDSYIPVVRNRTGHRFEAPTVDKTSEKVDSAYWLEHIMNSFTGYIKRTTGLYEGDKRYAERVLKYCKETWLARVNPSALQGTSTLGLISYDTIYAKDLERFSHFVQTHEDLISRLPDYEEWIALALAGPDEMQLATKPEPLVHDPGLWKVLYAELLKEFPQLSEELIVSDLVLERFVYAFQLGTRLETHPNVMLTHQSLALAVKRLKEWNVYPMMMTIYTAAFQQFTQAFCGRSAKPPPSAMKPLMSSMMLSDDE